MNCALVHEWLERDFDGVAEPSADAAEHLERCEACRAEAGRLRALAASARAALPRADVPADFTEQVMAALLEPSRDSAVAAAARPRARRWLLLLLIPLALPALLLLRTGPAVEGAVYVERNGAWAAADGAAAGERFGLDGEARIGDVRLAALRPSLLGSDPLTLHAGSVRIESGSEPVVVETPLAEIRLRAHGACTVSLDPFEEECEMNFDRLTGKAPVLLSVGVLLGGAVIANAQGEEEAKEGEGVRVQRDHAPAPEKLHEHLQEIQRRIEEAHEHLRRLHEHLDGAHAGKLDTLRVSVKGENLTMESILEKLGAQVDVKLVADPRLAKARITVDVRDVPLRDCLDRMLRAASGDVGYGWRVRPDGTVLLGPREPDEWSELVHEAKKFNAEARKRLARMREQLRDRLAVIDRVLGKHGNPTSMRIADLERHLAKLSMEIAKLERDEDPATAKRLEKLWRERAETVAALDRLREEAKEETKRGAR